jgi:hypothetical protein
MRSPCGQPHLTLQDHPSIERRDAEPRTFTQGKALFIRDWTSAWPELEGLPGQVGRSNRAPLPSAGPRRFPRLATGRGGRIASTEVVALSAKHLCSPATQKTLALAIIR